MKNSDILKKYIKLVIEGDAHVPTQLIAPENAEGSHEESEKDTDEEVVDEFATVAGAMGGSGLGGFTAPLGAKKKKKK